MLYFSLAQQKRTSWNRWFSYFLFNQLWRWEWTISSQVPSKRNGRRLLESMAFSKPESLGTGVVWGLVAKILHSNVSINGAGRIWELSGRGQSLWTPWWTYMTVRPSSNMRCKLFHDSEYGESPEAMMSIHSPVWGSVWSGLLTGHLMIVIFLYFYKTADNGKNERECATFRFEERWESQSVLTHGLYLRWRLIPTFFRRWPVCLSEFGRRRLGQQP